MATILKALLWANPEIDVTSVKPGPNTASEHDDQPTGWVPWSEFNYDTLTDIFSRQLYRLYRGGQNLVPDALLLDLRIYNEAILQVILDRFVIPAVNHYLYL